MQQSIPPPPPPPPPLLRARPSGPTSTTPTIASTSTSTSTSTTNAMEAEVDNFLSSLHIDTNNDGKNDTSDDKDGTIDNPPKLPRVPLLHPKPLKYMSNKNNRNNDTKIDLLLELVSRRAWTDIIKLSDELLFSNESLYQSLSSELMNIDSEKNGNSDNGDDSQQQLGPQTPTPTPTTITKTQRDFIQIIQWRIRSFLHLRKLNDLEYCIEKMNLTCFNYWDNKLPPWIPVRLILQSMECMIYCNKYRKETSNENNNKSNTKQKKKGDSTTATTNNNTQDGDDDNDDDEKKDKSDDEILDEFYTLREKLVDGNNTTNAIINNQRGTTWNDVMELDIILSNILIQNSEWRLTLVTLEEIIAYSDNAASCWAKKLFILHQSAGTGVASGSTSVLLRNTSLIIQKAILIEMYSRQGRVLLQAGALPAAATIFERAHDVYQELEGSGIIPKVIGTTEKEPDERTSSSSSFSVAQIPRDGHILAGQMIIMNIPTQILINEGLLHFAHMDYDLAEIKFNRAIQSQRKENEKANLNADVNTEFASDQFMNQILDMEGDLLVPCINNFALCALYTCRMRDAVTLIESLVKEDPTRYMNHCVVFNLCTLYELGWDTATSDKKKRVLQVIAKRFSLNDVEPDSFRLH